MSNKIEFNKNIITLLTVLLLLTLGFLSSCVGIWVSMSGGESDNNNVSSYNVNNDDVNNDDVNNDDIDSVDVYSDTDDYALQLYDSSNDRGFDLDYTNEYNGSYVYWEGEEPNAESLKAWGTQQGDFSLSSYELLNTTLDEARNILGSNMTNEYSSVNDFDVEEYTLESETTTYKFRRMGIDNEFTLYSIETVSPDLKGARDINIGDRKNLVTSNFPEVGEVEGYLYRIVEVSSYGGVAEYSCKDEESEIEFYINVSGLSYTLTVYFYWDYVSKIKLEVFW